MVKFPGDTYAYTGKYETGVKSTFWLDFLLSLSLFYLFSRWSQSVCRRQIRRLPASNYLPRSRSTRSYKMPLKGTGRVNPRRIFLGENSQKKV